ncbi:MAG: winged helix-turn-helix transcriptional regulator, partial [Pedobacter sp.]
MSEKKYQFTDCPITKTAEVIGGKWTLPIIFALIRETKRFKELERHIEGINTRMLVKELK